jgi:hypothetical protein
MIGLRLCLSEQRSAHLSAACIHSFLALRQLCLHRFGAATRLMRSRLRCMHCIACSICFLPQYCGFAIALQAQPSKLLCMALQRGGLMRGGVVTCALQCLVRLLHSTS